MATYVPDNQKLLRLCDEWFERVKQSRFILQPNRGAPRDEWIRHDVNLLKIRANQIALTRELVLEAAARGVDVDPLNQFVVSVNAGQFTDATGDAAHLVVMKLKAMAQAGPPHGGPKSSAVTVAILPVSAVRDAAFALLHSVGQCQSTAAETKAEAGTAEILCRQVLPRMGGEITELQALIAEPASSAALRLANDESVTGFGPKSVSHIHGLLSVAAGWWFALQNLAERMGWDRDDPTKVGDPISASSKFSSRLAAILRKRC